MVLSAERFAAHVARVRTFIRVSPDVYEQVVRLAEFSVAVRANVSFLRFATRRGFSDRSHLFLDVPGQSHGPGVALYLAASKCARMPPESRPDRVYVQRWEVAVQQTACATESSGGELHRLSGGHHGSSVRL